jgi:arginyl-tRNA synthetase
MHRLERGELRADVERIVRAQLETCFALGAEYDLLVWESDVVAPASCSAASRCSSSCRPCRARARGKYAGALVMDVSAFLPGLEEPQVVLVRSDGNAMYVAKDIGYHLWKVGRLEGLRYAPFTSSRPGAALDQRPGRAPRRSRGAPSRTATRPSTSSTCASRTRRRSSAPRSR